MTRLPLILAADALQRLARRCARAAGVPCGASLRFVWGRWYVHREQPDVTRYGEVVWPEGAGGCEVSEYFDCAYRGAVFTVLAASWMDGGHAVTVTLTRDEVTGDGAETLRGQRDERTAAEEKAMEEEYGR